MFTITIPTFSEVAQRCERKPLTAPYVEAHWKADTVLRGAHLFKENLDLLAQGRRLIFKAGRA